MRPQDGHCTKWKLRCPRSRKDWRRVALAPFLGAALEAVGKAGCGLATGIDSATGRGRFRVKQIGAAIQTDPNTSAGRPQFEVVSA